MNRRAKQMVLSALTTIMAAASLTVATAPQASAINAVPCGRGELVEVVLHFGSSEQYSSCYANAGAELIRDDFAGSAWVTRISTGNNRVQWYGDGKWQPSTPIDKWTTFTWPNHPGGVHIDAIGIH